MPMLDRASWLTYIKTSLGYPVVNVYMTDEMIQQQITFAIKKVIPYVNAVEFIQVGRVTKFTDKLVYAVLRVHEPGSSFVEGQSYQGSSYYDLLIARSIYNQLGGTDLSQMSGSQGLVNAALYNYQYEETRADLCPIGFRLVGDTLFVDANGSGNVFTAECVTERSLSNITEDYCSWLLRYSLCLCKQIEGRLLRKCRVSGSPVESDGEALLNEGSTEQKELEEKLGNQMSLYFCTR